MVNGTLALATSIAAMDRDGLSRLVAARRILAPDSVSDPLSLALELLRPDSVSRALRNAHRDSLATLLALRDASEGTHDSAGGADGAGTSDEHDDARLRALARIGLVGIDEPGGDFVALPEVAEALHGVELPEPYEQPAAAANQRDTTSWYGQGLASVRRAAELLRRLARHPVRLGRRGTVTVIALRELAHDQQFDLRVIEHLLDAMQTAELLTSVTGHGASLLLAPSHRARAWLALDYPHRWLALARCTIDGLDEGLREDLIRAGHDLRTLVARAPLDYPLLPGAELEALLQFSEFCEELGLTVDGRLTAAAIELLHGRHEAAERIVEQQFPPAVSGVYLQPDLSLIVPGPLAPADEAALGAIAETEQLGAAATMRLSQGTLERAVRAGVSASRIREVLERLSLTGIPQPLRFLLSELERRHPSSAGAKSVPEDPAASPSATAPTPEPVSDPSAAPQRDHRLDELVERVLAAAQTSGGDLSRRLELAIRHRSAVQVTAVSGSDERVFTLLPVSLRDGRLRATDQQAGVERTLPVSAITAVEAA